MKNHPIPVICDPTHYRITSASSSPSYSSPSPRQDHYRALPSSVAYSLMTSAWIGLERRDLQHHPAHPLEIHSSTNYAMLFSGPAGSV